MTSKEEKLLAAVAWMAVQYLEEDGRLDHLSMSAGEQAMELLSDYGLIDSKERGAKWTNAGREFLQSH